MTKDDTRLWIKDFALNLLISWSIINVEGWATYFELQQKIIREKKGSIAVQAYQSNFKFNDYETLDTK